MSHDATMTDAHPTDASPGAGPAAHGVTSDGTRPLGATAPPSAPPSSGRPKRLGDQLLEQGVISADQLEIAIAEQKRQGGFLGEALVTLGFVDQDVLTSLISDQSGIETFDQASALLDPEAVRLIPKQVAVTCRAVPFSLVENELHLAMADPQDVLALDQLQRHLPAGMKLAPRLCDPAQLAELIDRVYSYELSIDGILEELETGEAAALSGGEAGYRHPLVRLVDAILFDAAKIGASDIHFEPEAMFLRLRYRIDGTMSQVRNFRIEHLSAIAQRIKLMADMNIVDRMAAQDGRFELRLGRRRIDYRVSSLPTVHGENIVLRVLDQSARHLSIEQLGLSRHNRRMVDRILKRPEGVILATGPTGSGKTTTLYSMLARVSTPAVNVMTLEDPVEYQLPLIRQTQIREASGLGFASGVRALLRQDPDVILIGEIRDHDTATMAMRAAMTGHRVLSTLHTNDAVGAIARLLDLGLEPGIVAGNVIAAIGQRLARRLCDHCKEPRPATDEERRLLGAKDDTGGDARPVSNGDPAPDPNGPPNGEPRPIEVYDARGCEACRRSGHRGRVSIMEILVFDEDLDELIARRASRSEIKALAGARGFRSMQEDGIERVLAGQISIESLIATVDMSGRL